MPINASGGRAIEFEDLLAQMSGELGDDVPFDPEELINLLFQSPETLKGTSVWRFALTGTSFQWGSFPSPQSTGSALGPLMFGPRRMGRPLMAGVSGAGASYNAGRWSLSLWS